MFVALDGNGPLYRQIYGGVRKKILNGRLGAGTRLPSSRSLATELGVSRNIVVLAFDQLIAEGYVTVRRGSGAYVAAEIPEAMTSVETDRTANSPSGGSVEPRLSQATRRMYQSIRGRKVGWSSRYRKLPIDFRYGRPDYEDFPHETWWRLLQRRARKSTLADLDYGPAAGALELREALASYLHRARGVDCSAEQILIVNGSQQGLDLIARTLLDPKDGVLIEDPHYIGARSAFETVGAELVPIRVDAEGLRTQDLPKRRKSIRLAYVTPSHQFPTGAVLPLARRLELLQWAERSGAYIFEDDYDSEYRYDGRPVESLQGLDTAGLVIYSGTFSKCMFPSLRLGYLVLPTPLVAPLVQMKAITDAGNATLFQLALADFLQDGHFERHIRRSRARNARKREILIDSVDEFLGDRAELIGVNAGLHVMLHLPGLRANQTETLRAKARDAGVGFYSAVPFYFGQPRRCDLILGYASVPEASIRKGIQTLANVLDADGRGSD